MKKIEVSILELCSKVFFSFDKYQLENMGLKLCHAIQHIENRIGCRCMLRLWSIHEGLDGGVWYSLFIKNLAHYSSH